MSRWDANGLASLALADVLVLVSQEVTLLFKPSLSILIMQPARLYCIYFGRSLNLIAILFRRLNIHVLLVYYVTFRQVIRAFTLR